MLGRQYFESSVDTGRGKKGREGSLRMGDWELCIHSSRMRCSRRVASNIGDGIYSHLARGGL
jgi:hypothetical protein